MISQKELKELLEYFPETGKFIIKSKFCYKVVVGTEAGCFCFRNGKPEYTKIRLKGKLYPAHKLAFLYMLGYMPHIVDHVDRDTFNNKWSNLREATKAQNAMNSKIPTDSTTGIKGITWEERANGYQARVAVNGRSYTKRFTVSKFPSKEETLKAATNWVKEKRLELHGTFANHG